MAGLTRSVGGPVVIARDFPVAAEGGATSALCTLRLIDTPGILEPRAQNLCGQLSLGICGAMDWNAVDKSKLFFIAVATHFKTVFPEKSGISSICNKLRSLSVNRFSCDHF